MKKQLGGLLVGLTLVLALVQFGAVFQAIPAEVISQISLNPTLDRAISGVWALIFALTAVNLVRNRPHSKRWAAGLIAGFVIYSTARLFFFTQADYDRQRLEFILIITLPLVALLTVYAAKQTE